MRKGILLVLVCCAAWIMQTARAEITVFEAMSPFYSRYHQLVDDVSISTRSKLYSKLSDFLFWELKKADEEIPGDMSSSRFDSYLIEVSKLRGQIRERVVVFLKEKPDAQLIAADREYLHKFVDRPKISAAAAAARPTPPPPPPPAPVPVAVPVARPTPPPPVPAALPARRRSPSPSEHMLSDARILLDNVKRATEENIDQFRKQWRNLIQRARGDEIIAVLRQVEAEIEAIDKRVVERVLKEHGAAVAAPAPVAAPAVRPIPPPPAPAASPARRRSPSPVSVRDFMVREQQIYRDIDHMSVDQLRESLRYLTERRPDGLSRDQQAKVENAIGEIGTLLYQIDKMSG